MAATLRAVLTGARARRAARHPAGAGFRDGRARAGDSAARAAGRRRHARPAAFAHAR
ncbi:MULTISPECIES: hypothetical protein [unclassified Streptomyces]|uniref:hypothetical protein n=1 Tax=unclassified Streptomyces TaxID=2593676 RepID=UPI0036FB7A0E